MIEAYTEPWFKDLTDAVRRPGAATLLGRSIGLHDNGAGAAPVLSVVAAGVAYLAAGWKVDAVTRWSVVATELSTAAATLAGRYPNIGRISPLERQLKVFGPLAKVVDLGILGRPRVVQESIALLALDAIRSKGSMPANAAILALTAARSLRRTTQDPDWKAFLAQGQLTEAGLQKLRPELVGDQCQGFVDRLLGAFNALSSIEPPPLNGLDDLPDLAGSGAASGDLVVAGTGTITGRGTKGPRPVTAPSVLRLKQRAMYASLPDTFGVPWVWHRLHPTQLATTTQALAAFLKPTASAEDRAFAVVILFALLIGHDFRPSLKLSLKPNDDLWYCRTRRCLVYNRRRLLRLRAPPHKRDLQHIPVPKLLADAVESMACLQQEPTDLCGLLGLAEAAVDGWLEVAESLVRSLGDTAHRSASARFAHSFGLALMHNGASAPLAALLSLRLELVADSSLNYLTVSEAQAFSCLAATFEFLGLGPLSCASGSGVLGNPHCPTDEQARAEWTALGIQAQGAIRACEVAVDLPVLRREYNRGSAANTKAYRWVTGARPQRYEEPSHADARTHARHVLQNDKEGRRSSARLVPRTPELDQILWAQWKLMEVAKARMLALGVAAADMPSMLMDPDPESPFFTEIAAKPCGDRIRYVTRVVGRKSLATAQSATDCLSANAARVFWLSKFAGPGVLPWMDRALAGHARGQAGVGGWCQGMAPSALLEQLRQTLGNMMKVLAWPPYLVGPIEPVPMLLPTMNLGFMDRRPSTAGYRASDMPDHYCVDSTLPACVVVEALRLYTGTADSEKPSKVTLQGKYKNLCTWPLSAAARMLLSLILVDGLTNRADVQKVWGVLRAAPVDNRPKVLIWTRENGQEIELPMQPQTFAQYTAHRAVPEAVHGAADGSATAAAQSPANDGATLPELAKVMLELRLWLQADWPSVSWPVSDDGLLSGLCWLACRWIRLHVAPIAVYAFEPCNVAVTFDADSRERLRSIDAYAPVDRLELHELTHRRTTCSKGKTDLQRLTSLLNSVAKNAVGNGEDERLSGILLKVLANSFDGPASRPMARWMLAWLETECQRWRSGHSDKNQLQVMYNNLTSLRPRLDELPPAMDPSTWDPADWRRFGAWLLDVSSVGASLRAGAAVARRTALRRIVSVMCESGMSIHCRHAVEADAVPAVLPLADSAARVFVSQAQIGDVREAIDWVYSESPLERAQAHVALEGALQGCARADEVNALQRRHVSDGVAVLTSSGFSHLKTRGSRRQVPLTGRLNSSLQVLCDLADSFPKGLTYLVSELGPTTNLKLGRDRQAVLVDLFRLALGTDRFVLHTLRGIGLMELLVPNWETHARRILTEAFPIESARAVVTALAGASPMHVAECFTRSGHANEGTPVAAYLPGWTHWYSAALRCTQGALPLSGKLVDRCNLTGRSDAGLRKRHSVHGGESLDDWCWLFKAVVSHSPLRAPKPPLALQASRPRSLRVDDRFEARLRYGVARILKVSQAAAIEFSHVGETRAKALERQLYGLPAFNAQHRTSAGRSAKDESNPQRRAWILANEQVANELLAQLSISSLPALQALASLIDNHEPELIGVPRLTLALDALPLSMGVEIVWHLDHCDTSIQKAFLHDKRVVVPQARGGRREPVCVRVHQVTLSGNDMRNTFLTTLTRIALAAMTRIDQPEK